MLPFPPKDEIDFFIGDRLDTITLAQYTLHFAFDGYSSVTAELAVSYVAVGEAPIRYDIQKMTAAPALMFHRCIGQNVAELEVDNLRLRFKFENGDVIEFETDEIPYECGQITRAAESGKEPVFIVF